MSETNNRPNRDGSLRGDSKAVPDRGTTTGMNGDSYGASLGRDATNKKGSAHSAPNPPGQCVNKEDRI